MKNKTIIFKYLDGINFSIIDKDNKLYFMNSEDNEFAWIKYDIKDGWCLIYWRLVGEICDWFPLENSDAEEVIGKWVEYTLQMRVTNTNNEQWRYTFQVENTLQMGVINTATASFGTRTHALVENTLQMGVINTAQSLHQFPIQVKNTLQMEVTNTTTLVSHSEMRVNDTRTIPCIFAPTVKSV
jgi:hypothetical protein